MSLTSLPRGRPGFESRVLHIMESTLCQFTPPSGGLVNKPWMKKEKKKNPSNLLVTPTTVVVMVKESVGLAGEVH